MMLKAPKKRPIETVDAVLKRWHKYRGGILCQARILAAHALVRFHDDQPVTLFEELAKSPGLVQVKYVALKALQFTGTEAAKDALRRIGTQKAQYALDNLESEKRARDQAVPAKKQK